MDIPLIVFKGLLTFITYYILGRLYFAVKYRNQSYKEDK